MRAGLGMALCLGAAGPGVAAGQHPVSRLDTASQVVQVSHPTHVAHPTTVAHVGHASQVTREANGAGALTIRIDELSPAIPVAGDTVTLRGTITNVSDAPVHGVRSVLRMSPSPLMRRGEIEAVLAGTGTREGEAIGEPQAVADVLAPDETAPFVLNTTIDGQLPGAGVYVIGAEALGDTGSGAARQDLDRTFLPWWPADSTAAPVQLTTLWPIAGRPIRDSEGILLSEDLAVDMSPAGRLTALVNAATGNPSAATVLLDPEVVEAGAEMADGYPVLDGSGQVVPGTRTDEVAAWMASLPLALNAPAATSAGTLYGGPDVVAAHRGGVLGDLLAQRASINADTAEILGQPMDSTLAIVPGGSADRATLTELAGAGVAAVVLSDRVALPEPGTSFTPSGVVELPTDKGPLRALLVDSGLAETLAMPLSTPAEVTAARQRLLAETLTTVLELPASQRHLIGAPASDWSPTQEAASALLGAIDAAPWIEPTPVAAALAREPSSVPRTVIAYGPEQAGRELPAAHVDQVRADFDALRAYASVVSGTSTIPNVTSRAPSREMSGWFRERPEPREQLAERVSEQLAAIKGSVRVVSSGSITVSGTTGTIPITVENTGPVSVTVGLSLTSSPPQLITTEPVAPFQIDAGRLTSVEVVAQIAAAEPIVVTVATVTPEGEPFGEPGHLTIETAAYAEVAAVVVIASLAVLVLAVALHSRRRARRRRLDAHPTDGGDPTDD